MPLNYYPPGLTLLAAAIRSIGMDPLAVLVSTMPLLLLITYIILVHALFPSFEHAAGALAFSALTPLCVLQWHTLLGTEPLALVLSALLFWIVVRGVSNSAMQSPINITLLVIVCWLLTMIRNAGIFIAIGAILAYATLRIDRTFSKVKFSAAAGFLVSIPLILFHFIFREVPPAVSSSVRWWIKVAE